MATIEELKQKITTLRNAGLPYDDELKQLQALQGQVKETPPEVAQQKMAEEEGEEHHFSPRVNPDTLSGGDYYPPEKAGVWKAKLVEIVELDEKDQQLFIVETADDRLKKQGRGALVLRLDTAAWVLTRTLDNLGIAYSVDSDDRVQYSIRLPRVCESEWQEIKTKGGKKELRIQNIYAVGKAPDIVL